MARTGTPGKLGAPLAQFPTLLLYFGFIDKQ